MSSKPDLSQSHVASEERPASPYPLSDLLTQLPRLQTCDAGDIDFAASDRPLVTSLAHNADMAGRTLLRGLASVSLLMAHAAPAMEEGAVGVEEIEALGLFMAEVGLLAVMLQSLQGRCRRVSMG